MWYNPNRWFAMAIKLYILKAYHVISFIDIDFIAGDL